MGYEKRSRALDAPIKRASFLNTGLQFRDVSPVSMTE